VTEIRRSLAGRWKESRRIADWRLAIGDCINLRTFGKSYRRDAETFQSEWLADKRSRLVSEARFAIRYARERKYLSLFSLRPRVSAVAFQTKKANSQQLGVGLETITQCLP